MSGITLDKKLVEDLVRDVLWTGMVDNAEDGYSLCPFCGRKTPWSQFGPPAQREHELNEIDHTLDCAFLAAKKIKEEFN